MTATLLPDDARIQRKVAESYRRFWGFPMFCADLLKVRAKDAQLKPFRLNPPQKAVWKALKKQYSETERTRLICLKCRQPGLSTMCEALLFWKVMHHENTRAISMAHDLEVSETLFEIIKVFYEEMPQHLRPERRYYTRRELSFERSDNAKQLTGNGANLRSSIGILTAGSRDSGIGRTTRLLHFSEAARYKQSEGLLTGALQAVPMLPGTMVLIESAAHPDGRWFKTEYERAKSGVGEYVPIFVPWFLDPEYSIADATISAYTPLEEQLRRLLELTDGQIAWRRAKITELDGLSVITGVSGEDLFAQEYPMDDLECWRAAGRTVFDLPSLLWAEHCTAAPLMEGGIVTVDKKGARFLSNYGYEDLGRPPLSVWQLPVKGRKYTIGADVAMGVKGGDFSDACVLDLQTKEQVAEWHGHEEPVAFAEVLRAMGLWYNHAHIAVEKNSAGYATHAKLLEVYPRVYRWRQRDRFTSELADRTGWNTTRQSKRYLVGLAKHYLAQKASTIRSRGLVEEMRTFICTDSEKFEASLGHHDDRVMAYMIALVAADDETHVPGRSTIIKPQPPAPRIVPWKQAVPLPKSRKRPRYSWTIP